MGIESETTILAKIQLAITKIGARVFRNQVGKYKLPDGRWVSSGLAVGSSDLIGWCPLTVTQDMVGKRLAVFTAIEVKTPKGRSTKQQTHFIKVVNNFGGVAFVARSPEEAEQKLLDFIKKSS